MRTFEMRHNNLDWLVHVLHDDTYAIPWREDADGEVIQVREIGAGVKRPGEVMLNSYLAADFSGALAQVRRDDWGVTGSPEAIAWAARLFGVGVRLSSLTRRQKAALATRLMIERWRAWCHDEWTYVEVGVQLLNLDGEVVDVSKFSDPICGIESDDEEGVMMAARDSADSEVTTYDAVKVAMMRAINSAEENELDGSN
jgi:hypothetical protein